MKLSKQERIAMIIIIVLVILAAGAFILVKPKIESISETKTTLAAKEAEYNEAVTKANRKDGLRTQILTAYDQGKNMADMFYPELSAYEADDEVRAFLEQSEAKIIVESLTVDAPDTATLSSEVFIPEEVKYALKDYVNQGSNIEALANDPRVVRQVAIRTVLGEPQTIGATNVVLSIKSETKEELMKFADELNNYVKTENGKSVRKAVAIESLYFSDIDVDKEFSEKVEEAQKLADEADHPNSTNTPGSTGTETNPNPAAPGVTEEEEEVVPLYEYTCKISFYSIERMQDPTPELDKQDTPV